MKLEDQVTSLELSKKLKELGVKQDSYFWWDLSNNQLVSKKEFEWGYDVPIEDIDDMICAFTVAELGGMLPFVIKKEDINISLCSFKNKKGYLVEYFDTHTGIFLASVFGSWKLERQHSEANCRANLLINLIENNLIEPQNYKATKEATGGKER